MASLLTAAANQAWPLGRPFIVSETTGRSPRSQAAQDAGPSVGEGMRGFRQHASRQSSAHTAPCKYKAKNFLKVSGWKPIGPTGSTTTFFLITGRHQKC